MNDLTVIIPFFNGHETIHQLLADLPANMPVIIVDDHSDEPLVVGRPYTTLYRPEEKGYFTGACNYAIERARGDVLVLNQDVRLHGTAWLDLIAEKRNEYALIGERIRGNHPAFPNGYVHGVFQFMRRDAIDKAGLMDATNYPLWGASALWQWQICRKGFKSLPVETVPGLGHWHIDGKPQRYGDSIQTLLEREHGQRDLLIRTPPAISLVIPAYNYGRYLPDALNSLIGGHTSLGDHPGQSFQSFEVIVVDDGSTDNTESIMQDYVTGWNGIRYIKRPNGGTAAANNTGISAAVGRYVTIMAADDMREPWSLDDLYQTASRNPGRVIYDELVQFADGQRTQRIPLADYDFETLLTKNMMHAGIMFERKAWEKVGGYPEHMKYGREDWAFNVALGEAGYCGLKINRAGYLYRREGQNRTLTNTNSEWRQRFLIQMNERFPHLYRGEWPMACCGKAGKSSGSRGGARAMATPIMPGGADMVLLEYKGKSIGSTSWGGPGSVPSGRYYRFGGNPRDRIKYIERQDLEWFQKLRENGLTLFSLYQPPTVQPAQTVTAQPEVSAGLDVKVQRIVEEPVKSESPPDPANFSVRAIYALDLTPDQWKELAVMEEDGRNRITVINHALGKVAFAETAA